jgi:hypothetical protein
MREPISEADQVLIASNLVASATIHLDFMSKRSYDFISNRVGFTRHNDRETFITVYKLPINLAFDILDLRECNQYENVQPGDLNYEYYMSVRKVYNAIVEGIMKSVSHSKRNN